MNDIAVTARAPLPVPVNRSCVVRIELSPTRRRQLGDLALAAGIPADEMAIRLVCNALADAEVKPSAVPPAQREPVARKVKTERRLGRPPRIRASTREPVEANGVHVDFRRSVVTYRGREVDVSSRQTDVVVVLAQAMPNLVARNQICDTAWPHLAPNSAANLLNTLREPLALRLERIGLTIHVERSLGLGLRVVEGE